ncbi:putative transmembrane protein [Anaeramoeba flamelloides]|uniref:Transmembrane protein n=1 Tax=Anaeramoeba flamelloides TaxID=1746091 RepID=A0AAV7Z2I8_9EUKA|nr:putative transmembrane protein [Anaeramoeba flamelloides]
MSSKEPLISQSDLLEDKKILQYGSNTQIQDRSTESETAYDSESEASQATSRLLNSLSESDSEIQKTQDNLKSIVKSEKEGIGVSLYVLFLKLMNVLLFVFALFAIPSLIIAKRDSRLGKSIPFQVSLQLFNVNEENLNLVLILLSCPIAIQLVIIEIFWFRTQKKVKKFYETRSQIMSSDFAVYVQHLPKKATLQQIGQFFSNYGEVYRIHLLHNTHDLLLLDNKRGKLEAIVHSKREQLRGQKNEQTWLSDFTPDFVKKNFYLGLTLSEAEDLLEDIELDIQEEQKKHFKFIGSALIIYKSVNMARNCLRQLTHRNCSRLAHYMSLIFNFNSHTIRKSRLSVRTAPLPGDLQWWNGEKTASYSFFVWFKKFFTDAFVVCLSILCILVLWITKPMIKHFNQISNIIIGILLIATKQYTNSLFIKTSGWLRKISKIEEQYSSINSSIIFSLSPLVFQILASKDTQYNGLTWRYNCPNLYNSMSLTYLSMILSSFISEPLLFALKLFYKRFLTKNQSHTKQKPVFRNLYSNTLFNYLSLFMFVILFPQYIILSCICFFLYSIYSYNYLKYYCDLHALRLENEKTLLYILKWFPFLVIIPFVFFPTTMVSVVKDYSFCKWEGVKRSDVQLENVGGGIAIVAIAYILWYFYVLIIKTIIRNNIQKKIQINDLKNDLFFNNTFNQYFNPENKFNIGLK